MKELAKRLRSSTFNRLLIISLHVIGWVTFLSLPFLFLEHPQFRRPMRGVGPGEIKVPPPEFVPQPGNFDVAAMRWQFMLSSIPLIIFFYMNMYVLIPGVLTKRSWVHYLAAVAAGFAFVLLAGELVNIVMPSGHFRPGRPVYFTTVNFLLVLGLSTALRLTSDRVKYERQREERENETLKSELSLLRSQISPHFMFNVLNNLASLARKKSDQLEPVIIQLSHLMRYMLYDSGEKSVTVEKEVLYLQSYIDLQKLRFGKEITVSFTTAVRDGSLPIEPMLLIPFLENAFKHGIGMIKDPAIEIMLSIEDHTLTFEIRNRYNVNQTDTKDPGSGIGIQNVRRRLELLYKDMHELKIAEQGDWFIVALKLLLR